MMNNMQDVSFTGDTSRCYEIQTCIVQHERYRWMIIEAIAAFIFCVDLRHGTVSKMFLPRFLAFNTSLKSTIFYAEIVIVVFCLVLLISSAGSMYRWSELFKFKGKVKQKLEEPPKKNYEFTDFISQYRLSTTLPSGGLRQRDSGLPPGGGRRRRSVYDADVLGRRPSIDSTSPVPLPASSSHAVLSSPPAPVVQHIFNPNISNSRYGGGGGGGGLSPGHSANASGILMTPSPHRGSPQSQGLLPTPTSLSYSNRTAGASASNSFAFDSPHCPKSAMNALLDNSMSNLNKTSPRCREAIVPLPIKVNTLSPVKHDEMLHTSLQQLTDYINKANEYDTSIVKEKSLNASWMFYGDNSLNIAPDLKSQIYQVAKNLPQPKKEVKVEKTEKEIIFVQSSKDYEILDICLENIRMWLDRTILKRVNSQIQRMNTRISNLGKIGESTISQLKTFSGDFPELQTLIPYLEVTENQNYLITRLNELSSGYCLNSYNWNAGNINWNENLPNDTQLIFHMFVCYMNSQLPVYSDLKKFSDKYIIISPAKLQSKPLFMSFSTLNPPNIEVIVDTESKAIEQGRNNMLTALLCFFWQIKKKRSSIIDRVSIGKSGLNIEWVFGED